MIINTIPLRKYQRFLEQVVVKGLQQYESICLDTKDKKLRFVTDRVTGELDLDLVKDPGEKDLPYLYVNTSRFFLLVREYDKLELRDDLTFYPTVGDGKFNLGPLALEDEAFPVQSTDGNDEDFELSLSDRGLMSYIQEAATFAESSITDSPFNASFLLEDRVVGSDSYIFYERLFQHEAPAFNFPLWWVDLLRTLPFEKLNVGLVMNKATISADEDNLIFSMAGSTNLSVPPVTDPEFIESYTFSSGFIISRQSLIDQLKFFKPFVKDAPNQRVRLSILKDQLSIGVVEDSKSDVNRGFPVKLINDELIGLTFQVNLDYLNKAISTFHTDEVKIMTSDDRPAINVIGLDGGEEDPSLHIIIVKLKAS